MVAWTPGLFSLLGEESFFPQPVDVFLSPLALAGPSDVRTLAALFWLLDRVFDKPETWSGRDHARVIKSCIEETTPNLASLEATHL